MMTLLPAIISPLASIIPRQAGARIHSNSWGINIGGYLFDDMKIDEFAHEHQVRQ